MPTGSHPHNASCAQSLPLPPKVVDCALALLPKPHKTSKRPADLRPLGLQGPSSKIVAMAVRERLQCIVQDFVMSRPQYAYIPGKSIDGAIARVMRHGAFVRDQMKNATLTVHDRRAKKTAGACCGGAMLSLDLSRAFDEVPRDALHAALEHVNVSPELRDLVINYATHAVRIQSLSKGANRSVSHAERCPARMCFESASLHTIHQSSPVTSSTC